jgi:hypothetical protein
MSIDQTKKFKLSVKTNDEAAEIFIIDSQFRRIEARTGESTDFTLQQGLYSVKVRTGSKCHEELIDLSQDEKVNFGPIAFSTPAPLEGTAKTHEYHVENAKSCSRKIHKKIGKGSWIFVFVRDWTSNTRSSKIKTLNRNTAKGLSLRNSQGQELVNLELSSNKEIKWDPWAACNIELNPGNYRLHLETAAGSVLEQAIVACQGWQTQVFLLQRNYGLKNRDLRADLSDAAIFMAKIKDGFKPQKPNTSQPEEPDFRLSELARQALLNDRRRLSENIIQQTIKRKFVNPMMGIYGAHLMLRNKEYDANLLKIVINNLRNLFETPHPDVEALALKVNIESSYVFDTPPMLRSSWAYVLEGSVQKPGLVPENSIQPR